MTKGWRTVQCPDCKTRREAGPGQVISHECPVRKEKYPRSQSDRWGVEFVDVRGPQNRS